MVFGYRETYTIRYLELKEGSEKAWFAQGSNFYVLFFLYFDMGTPHSFMSALGYALTYLHSLSTVELE